MNWKARLKDNKLLTRLALGVIILLMVWVLAFNIKTRTFRPPLAPGTPVAAQRQEITANIQKYGLELLTELHQRFTQVQTARLKWYAVALLGFVPLLGFSGFLLFPFVWRRRHKVGDQYPHISTSQIFKFYLVQAALAWLVLLTLGFSLWLIQLAVAELGNETNPELVLQEKMTDYIIQNRRVLTERFPDVYSQVSQDLQSLPDEPLIALIMRSGLKVQNSEILGMEATLVEYSWPTFNDFFLVSLALVLFFYLRRFWFDVKTLLYYPLRIMSAEKTRRRAQLMWRVGWRVMKTELKVTFVFSFQVLVLAALLSFAMSRFFTLAAAQQILTTSAAMSYVIEQRGDAQIAAIAILLELFYLIEAIILFLLAFSFLIGRVTNAVRARFNGYLTFRQAGQAIRLQLLHFVWATFLATVLVTALLYLIEWLVTQYVSQQNYNWSVVLIVPPLLLLIGLNLGMWLLRGFKSIYLLSQDSFKIVHKGV